MNRIFTLRNSIVLLVIACLTACTQTEFVSRNKPANYDGFRMVATDISFLPTIRKAEVKFKNHKGEIEDVLVTLKKSGINTIRLRIWNNPENPYSSIASMQQFSEEIKKHGMKVYLTLHFSDTWADPGHQYKPKAWEGLSATALQDSIYTFTKTIMQGFQPDYIQLGNEINNGILWPEGRNIQSETFLNMLKAGSKAVREVNARTKIILHYSGYESSPAFFKGFRSVDYDIIGLSYYPKWHGGDFDKLGNTMNDLSLKENKAVLIAETAYPFTTNEADQTKNVIDGKNDYLPQYPVSPAGQARFVARIKSLSNNLDYGAGFCYWGGAWVSTHAMDSMWENQTLWDFKYQALPVLAAFKN